MIKYKRELDECQAITIRELRNRFDVMRGYLDDEIADAYAEYCDLFHAANWTSVNLENFVAWATTPPIQTYKCDASYKGDE